MAGNVKGITIEIGGDTTKLGKALSDSEKQSRNLQKELKQVNTALKFNPSNVDLLAQKQKILTDQIQATKEKLDTLREAEAQVEAQFNAGEIGEEQFRAFQREIIETESKLKSYEQALEETSAQASALDELTSAISEQEAEVERLKNEWKNAVLTYGENSEEANKLAQEIDELSSELKDNKQRMSELDKAADDLDNSLEDVEDSAEKAGDGFTVMKGVLADLASRAIVEAGRALTNLAKQTLEVGMSFEQSMSNNAALFGATGEELDKLSETAQHFGETTQFSASEAADALGYMALAGWDAEKATSELGGVLDLAASSGMGLAEASDMVTDYLSAFSNTTMTAAEFADKLAYAQANSNTTAVQLGEAYKNSAANLNAAGQDVETVTSLLAAMANQGLKGSEAGTALSAMMRDLTAKMKDGAVQIGDTSVKVMDAEGNYRDLTDILRDVEAATDGMGDAEKAAALSSTFTADSIKGLNLVLNDGVEKAAEFENGLRDCDGAAGNMADTMNDNVAGSLKLLKSNIESKMIKVFERAKGSIKDSIGSMSDALDSVNWDKVGDAVGRFAEKVANLFTFLVKHAAEVKAALMAIGTVIATVFVTNKIATFVQSLSTLGPAILQVATKFGLLKGATDAAAASTKLLALAQMALPWVALAAGVAAVITAVSIYNDKQVEAAQSEYKLSEAQRETIDAVEESKRAYEDLANARAESMAGINNEFGYLNELKSEYNSLIDSNGKVKDGYQDRANFIINQLASALGVERSEIEKQIQANGQLGESIDQIIQKKQAEATLAANEQAYTTAIQNRGKALQELQGAQKTLTEAESKYSETRAAANNVMKAYDELLKAHPTAANEYLNGNMDILAANDEAKASYEKAKKAVQDAETTYIGYNTTIQNYEGLSSAIISGDADKIAQALVNMQNNFITAENGTRESLQRQVQDFQQQYESLKQAVDEGMPGVTQAQVDAMADLVTQAKGELDKLPPEARTIGAKTGTETAAGIEETRKDAKKAAEKIASNVKGALDSPDTKKSGQKKGSDYAAGVGSAQGQSTSAGQAISNAANAAAGSANLQATGQKKGLEFSTGVGSTSGNASTAGKKVAESSKSGAGSVNLTPTGQKEGGQFVTGVSSKSGSAKTAGKTLASNAKSGSESVSAYSSGQNFGQGFINGIGSLFGAVWTKAKQLAKKAWDGLRAGQKEGSPSKLTYQSGLFFDEGYINAIRDKTQEAVNAAREMAEKTAEALGITDVSEAMFGDMAALNGATFGRQLENTFTAESTAPDFSAILKRLDALETAIVNSNRAIVLDTGVLVGETINKIDSGLANTYALKARGI